jgi:uncharacterized protein YfaS (alpha-2-macroglobulin family)
MKSKKFSLILVLVASVIITTGFVDKTLFGKVFEIPLGFEPPPAPPFVKEDYEKLWKRVDSCTNKGLSKTALETVDKIYKLAKDENNAPQFVKAVIHKMKFWQYREEFSIEKSINELEKEVAEAKFPIKPVLQTILANSYWQYYQNNRWKFYNRTATVNFKKEDVSTWSLNDIVAATIKNYSLSIENTDELKKTKVGIYDEIISRGSTDARNYRPTLYDFLANRAVDFFKNSESDLNQPANQFHVNDEVLLKPYTDFISAPLPKPEDSLDLKYNAVKILQDLTKFHLADAQPDALIDVELNRLHFIFLNSNNEQKDSLYLNSLRFIAEKFNSNKMAAEVYYRVAEYYDGKSSRYEALKGDEYKWMKKKAYSICEWVKKKYPSTYGSSYCESLMRTIENRSVNINIESVNTPGQPFRALVTYRNIPKMYYRILKVDYKEAKDEVFYNLYGEKLMKKLAGMTAYKTFEDALPDDGDYNTHKAEVKFPELPAGYYVLFASTNADFDLKKSIFAYSRFWNSNIAYINRNREDGSEEFFVMDRMSGEPLVGASVQPHYQYYDYSKRRYVNKKGEKQLTDANGRALIKKITEKEDNTFYVDITNGTDRLFSENSYSLYQYNREEYERGKTFLFLDRAIYRPGQTIYFKGIHLIGDSKKNKLAVGQKLTYTLYDVNYQKISSLDLTTNEYGTVSGTFTAPMGVLTGQMHITDGYGTAYFRVEEYKRPKFETTFNPVKGTYRINEEISVLGQAKAFAGYNIDGASVKYRVVRNVRYPYWYYWWYRGAGQTNATEITNGTLTTNDTGGYVIKFNALPDPTVAKKNAPVYSYMVYADVTDINGETRSASTYVQVGYKSLEMTLGVEDKIEKSELDSISVSIRNLNGVDEATAGTYAIYRLKQPEKVFRSRLWDQPDKFTMSREEYYKAFPHDLYADEDDMSKWAREAKVADGAFDTGRRKKFSIKNLKDQKSGIYLVEGFCKDKNGEEVKDLRFFTLYSEGDANAPEEMTDWFFPVKGNGEPGEKASFIQASALPLKYLFSIEHDDKILSTEFKTASMSKIEMDIKEEHRGNFGYSIAFIKNNRFYSHMTTVSVPWSNKELDIQFETFRNKLLPGQQEEWKLTIKDKKKEQQTAEMIATMYDASLDEFATNYWNFNIYNYYYNKYYFNGSVANNINSNEYNYGGHHYHYAPHRYYDQLNYYGLSFYSYGNYYYRSKGDYLGNGDVAMSPMVSEGEMADESKESGGREKLKKSASQLHSNDRTIDDSEETKNAGITTATTTAKPGTGESAAMGGDGKDKDMSDVKARSNFNETAFFFPQLATNEKGEIVIKFTVPESLTKWKMMGFAHTKDLKYGQITKELVTQKELMVQPNPPRFFREGDKMTFSSKVSNLSDKKLEGTAELMFTDPLTGKDITAQLLKSAAQLSFSNAKGQSAPLSWDLEIPFGVQAVTFKVVAKAGNFSDGEEAPLPILTNRMLVTESMPLPIRSNQTKTFSFEKFINQNNNSTTLKNHRLTLEFTANPAWYAVQSLPYLMEYPYECSEQTFARFYANSISSNIANSKPKIKAVFDSWKSSSPDAFLSNLEKNQELKSLLLEETPWVLDAKDESERKKRVGLLFDLNKMSYELSRAQTKLLKSQTPNGGWSWFEGMPDDWYITQHIVTGMGHLDRLGVKKIREDYNLWNAVKKAVYYCDNRMREEYEEIKRWNKDWDKEDHLGYMAIQYLYARSYFKELPVDSRNKTAFSYFEKQAQKYWLGKGRYMQGMLALGLHRFEDKKTPMDIMRSLKENSLNSEEMGMYWKENYEGFYWYEAPIESQALLIEAFDEVAKDYKAVDDLKVWLLKSKQTQNWESTKATTEAVYALLLRGTDWLATEPNVTIDLGDIKIDPKNDKELKAEAGTGYFKKAWTGSDIKPAMGKVTVKKSDEGVSWGAVYWQYFENLDKITPHATPLKLVKKLFLVENTKAGEVLNPISETTKLKPGDKIKVRIELKVDRDMQYVHMKDMRAAGFEPTNVISRYKWQDGLGYYESTRDAATNFFFSYLNKGSYVFEYPVVVSHYGDFSNGVTTIQCMYAPEFTSHSEGIRVKVAK